MAKFCLEVYKHKERKMCGMNTLEKIEPNSEMAYDYVLAIRF